MSNLRMVWSGSSRTADIEKKLEDATIGVGQGSITEIDFTRALNLALCRNKPKSLCDITKSRCSTTYIL